MGEQVGKEPGGRHLVAVDVGEFAIFVGTQERQITDRCPRSGDDAFQETGEPLREHLDCRFVEQVAGEREHAGHAVGMFLDGE
ncbi:hypothetical protein NRB56_76750 [Nocardia sp. RB56]|uniref:Uncharacterized protein n=1 Tax=Nocardia aurantia TaxID=2585199 RepID=A0A7K0E2L8_9NOCA|nr:hypothetical protein [Nocardia aurantia]